MIQRSYCFLAPEEAERKLIDQVDRLFESQIRAATVRRSIQNANYVKLIRIPYSPFHLRQMRINSNITTRFTNISTPI